MLFAGNVLLGFSLLGPLACVKNRMKAGNTKWPFLRRNDFILRYSCSPPHS